MACENPNHDRVVRIVRTRREYIDVEIHGFPGVSDLALDLAYGGTYEHHGWTKYPGVEDEYNAEDEQREDGLPSINDEEIE